jgi:hypothetical protein
MIHKSTFLKEVREIYPEGDLDKSYNLLISILEDEQYTSDGAACDYDFIMKKFRGYHKSWSLKYGKKFERGYLDKKGEDTRYSIYHFLSQAIYKRDFETTIQSPERDQYLFGDNIEALYERIKEIEEHL